MKKEIKKENPTRIDREADGKQELDYGTEDLEKDKIKGGLGDDKKPSDFDPEQVEMGIKVEMEHTDDPAIAKEIALDHLTEDPNYYTKLKTIEKSELADRWDLLKAKLDNESAIISIADEMRPDEEEQDADSEDTQMGEESSVQNENADAQADMGEEGASEAGEEKPGHVGEAQEQFFGDEDQQQEKGGASEEERQHLFEDELLQMQMQNEGFSQSQIDYILHGHVPATATSEDVKNEAEKAMSEIQQVSAKNDQTQESGHKQELHEQGKAHRDEVHRSKHDHQARMNDLDYEKAKKALEREAKDEGILTDNHHKHLSSEAERSHKDEINKLERLHIQRMKDLEYEMAHKDGSANDIDLEHKKKILALEYQKAEKEAALELEYKKQEMKLKIEQMKQCHADKAVMGQEAHKHKMSQQAVTNKAKMTEHKQGLHEKAANRRDAAQTSEAEKKGKDNG